MTNIFRDRDADREGIDFSWSDVGDPSNFPKISVKRLSIEGRKLRVESREADGKKLSLIWVFDGTVQKLLSMPKEMSGHPRIFISSQFEPERAGSLEYSALMKFFTPLDPNALCDFSSFTLSDLRLPIDGSKCLILHNTDARNSQRILVTKRGKSYVSSSVQRDYWIDPARDDVLLRYTCGSNNEAPDMQVDMEYRQDAKLGWMLHRWITFRSKNGRINEARLHEITKLEINPTFDKNEFDIEIPADAVVRDSRKSR